MSERQPNGAPVKRSDELRSAFDSWHGSAFASCKFYARCATVRRRLHRCCKKPSSKQLAQDRPRVPSTRANNADYRTVPPAKASLAVAAPAGAVSLHSSTPFTAAGKSQELNGKSGVLASLNLAPNIGSRRHAPQAWHQPWHPVAARLSHGELQDFLDQECGAVSLAQRHWVDDRHRG
jgi:hypothetical protein